MGKVVAARQRQRRMWRPQACSGPSGQQTDHRTPCVLRASRKSPAGGKPERAGLQNSTGKAAKPLCYAGAVARAYEAGGIGELCRLGWASRVRSQIRRSTRSQSLGGPSRCLREYPMYSPFRSRQAEIYGASSGIAAGSKPDEAYLSSSIHEYGDKSKPA